MSESETRAAQHLRTSGRTEYLTPKWVLDALGKFDLDPCASVVRPWPTATKHYTIEDDGLVQPWSGFIFLNPPYGKADNGTSEIDWVRKLVAHDPGGIALLSAGKTETKLFQRFIFPECDGILFLTPRIQFCNTDGSSTGGTFGPSCLVAFSEAALERLRSAVQRGLLGGYVVIVDSMEGHRPDDSYRKRGRLF